MPTKPAAAPKTNSGLTMTNSAYYANLLGRFPDYQNFGPEDFAKLDDEDIKGMLGWIGRGTEGYEMLIPKAMTAALGNRAESAMAHMLAAIASDRGQPAMYAEDELEARIIRHTPKLKGVVYANQPVTAAKSDGTTANTTTSELLHYAIVEQIAATSSQEPKTLPVVIPQKAIAAVVAANSNVPTQVSTKNITMVIGDEEAFFAGYAARAGAGKNIGITTMQFPETAYCGAMQMQDSVFGKGKPEQSVPKAYAAGYIVKDMDTKSDAEYNAINAQCRAAKTSVANNR